MFVGAGDGRQRPGHLAEPGAGAAALSGAYASEDVVVASGRPPHLILRGLLAVRAPPPSMA